MTSTPTSTATPRRAPLTWTDVPPTTYRRRDRLAWYASVACWAPSKHNTQPWRFVVCDGSSLEIWDDPDRGLPATDGNGRERLLSIGAALHLACVAARALGYRPHLELFPHGASDLVARLTEAGPWEVSDDDRALLAAVPLRRTDRGPLDAASLPPSLPFLLQCAASEQGATLRLVTGAGDRASLAGLVARADRLLASRGEADRELLEWLRAPGDTRPDGVPTDHTRGAAASYRAEFVQRDFSAGASVPAQNRQGPDHPLVGILCTTGDRSGDWVCAGRALASVLLRAATFGAHASYLNQPLEEPPLRTALHEQLGLPGSGQLVLRLGIGAAIPATPRRADPISWEGTS